MTIAAVFGHAQHLRDNISGFSHSNRITDGNAFFRNKILIMQRGAADGGTRQMNAFQHSGRGQYPGTTYGDLNIQQLCFFLLRRVLESYRRPLFASYS